MIGTAAIQHTGEPVFWVDPERPCSIRASGALNELESSYGGEINQLESPSIADLLAIVALKNGVDITSSSFLDSITLDKSTHQRLSSALQIHKDAYDSRKKETTKKRPEVRTALAFFKCSEKYDASPGGKPASDQFNALSFKEKKPFHELAAYARYERYYEDMEAKLI